MSLCAECGRNNDEILKAANALLKNEYKISFIIIQVEPYSNDMDTCQICVEEVNRAKANSNSLALRERKRTLEAK